MKQPQTPLNPSVVRWLALVLALLSTSSVIEATPYASGVTNAAGTVSFVLNEDADNVSVVFNNGASTNNLGALRKGLRTFSLGANTSFRIVVSKNSALGYTSGNLLQISDDSTPLRFNAPRGVAVNQNPASPYFGRIYVANAVAGTTTAATNAAARSLSDGIYVLNADHTDALNQKDVALTGGIAFDKSGTVGSAPEANSPWRIEVGEDNNLYIADFSTVTGSIYVTDPNVSAGSGLNVFVGMGTADPTLNGHGRFGGSAVALGSLSRSNLTIYSLEGDLASINGLRKYDIGAGPLPFPATSAMDSPNLATPLIGIVNVTVDMDRGPDGKFFLLQNRSVGTEAGLYVIGTEDADGDGKLDILFNSLTATKDLTGISTNVDILRISRAIKVSPDGKRAAIIRDDNNIWVLGLTNGVPDLTTRVLLTNTPLTTIGRDISFDAAGNIYTASSGQLLLRVFSPGGQSTAITGSDGTFNVTIRQLDQFVSVNASDDSASEAGTDAGTFTITRAGPTTAALTVDFTLSGTAANGVDYVAVPLSATIPAGATEVTVTIKPLDDAIAEAVESVVLNLVAGSNYGLRVPSTASIVLADNDTPSISVAAPDANSYERIPSDTAKFTLERLGRVDVDLTVNYTLSGTATAGVDYEALPGSIVIPAGATNVTLAITPIDDAQVEGDETVILTPTNGAGYSVVAGSSASIRIQDDDDVPVPAAQLVFSDNFDTDSSSKWTTRFGANNLPDGAPNDFDALFAYNYGLDGIPSAPHSSGGTTLGVKVQVNRNDPTPLGSAGVNLYPVGGSFSGDFALRFDMYLSVAGASTTEHAIAGINHSGSLTNRATQSADARNSTAGGDGIWFAIVTDASDLRDYGAYTVTNATSLPTLITSRSASTLTSVIPNPPFGFAGSPANSATSGNAKTWADVEISQVGTLVTLKVNHSTILQVTNTTAFKSGNIMIGHNDQFDSVGSIDNYTIFDNVRVVKLEAVAPVPPSITRIQFDATGAAQIRFTASNATATQFNLQSADNLNSPIAWRDETVASVQSVGADTYQVTVPRGAGAIRFYRIKR
jgi:hypothetical protein